ncbi:efflux transporter outer membrane subunit [Microbulbifer sediminum]|uniref:efflux transporter outer membrane subunit n=1 Tax=Microbulbifer sediminum TaxID=2904250 RepID=UPI001F014FE8|nr:efflux transporter outer membrane subunit [Microbulbifer sediminum]
MRKYRIVAGGLLAGSMIAGCAVGPEYRVPVPDVGETFAAEQGDQSFDATAEQQFWRGFDDPLLAQLVRQSLDANQDIRAAVSRYQRAASLLQLARREQLPGVTAAASAGESQPALVDDPDGNRRERYEAGIALDWELDLFGRLQRASEAQRARLQAAEADLGALQVSMIGELAASYFELRGLQQQLLVAQGNVDNLRDSLDIVEARLAAGRGTELDRSRAQAQLAQTRAAIPELQGAIRVRMHRIAVLSGQQPAALVDRLQPAAGLPQSQPAIPAGSPVDLLRRRPDVRAAERRLAAATADVGIVTADLFPRLTLGALLGSVAGDSGKLFSGPAESRSVALGVDWSFLNRGRVRARIDAAGAEARAALADYRQSVLNALEETENSLVQHRRNRERAMQLRHARSAAQRAEQLARARYDEGLSSYFEVLDAQRQANAARDAEVRGHTAEVVSMVSVYRALAGAPAPAAHYAQNQGASQPPLP